ncbi:hypothetical protein ECG_08181 [Echinococcus granulosus]|nr:hypothetical protein ECG_08181 [Echinococcus granulosus]
MTPFSRPLDEEFMSTFQFDIPSVVGQQRGAKRLGACPTASPTIHYYCTSEAAFCRNSRLTLLFIDDGLPISIIILPPEIQANLHHGKSSSVSPRGLNRWSVEKQEVPWAVYPTYMCGAFLLLGFPQLERLAIGMLFTQAFPLEDAYTGVVAARLGLRPGSMYDLVRPEHILTKRPRNLESVEHFPSRI